MVFSLCWMAAEWYQKQAKEADFIGEAEVIRVECVGEAGECPTPKGMMMFWDTGKFITPVQLAEAMALQRFAFCAEGKVRKEAGMKLGKLAMQTALDNNVYPPPPGYAALADDGRILVSTPYYEQKEP